MYTRHQELPQLNHRASKVEAHYFNRVQTAFKRIDKEIRFKIPKLKHLDLILQKDAWIVVDTVLNDVPILVWTNFETQNRKSLHEPIKCEMLLFHFAATMILERTLVAMDEIIKAQLADTLPKEMSSIARIERKNVNLEN